MRVGQLMTQRVVSVQLDDSLRIVKDIFDNTCFHHLLVVDAGKLQGVVSDRDLLKAMSPNIDTPGETAKDLASLNKKVHQVMTRELITINAEAGIYAAIKLFNQHRISSLPVVDEKGKALGILSWRDIFKALEEKRNQRLEKI